MILQSALLCHVDYQRIRHRLL